MTGSKPAATGYAAYPSLWRSSIILAVLVCAYIISYIDRQLITLLVKPIKADLRIGDFQISLLAGVAFALFYSIFGIPVGRMADRKDRLKLIASGMMMWSIATFFTGLSNSFFMLFACRVLVAIGEAALAPASYSLLGDLFPPHRLVRATAILGLAANLSAGLAMLLGGRAIVLSASLDSLPLGLSGLAAWHRTFILVSLPGFCLALAIIFLKEPLRRTAPGGRDRATLQVFRGLWEKRASSFQSM